MFSIFDDLSGFPSIPQVLSYSDYTLYADGGVDRVPLSSDGVDAGCLRAVHSCPCRECDDRQGCVTECEKYRQYLTGSKHTRIKPKGITLREIIDKHTARWRLME